MLSKNGRYHLDKILFDSSPPDHPLLRAIVSTWKEKRTEGQWYQSEETPETEAFSFAFLGFRRKPQLEPENLWLGKCRICHQKIPVLIVQRTFHFKEIIPGRREEKNKTESLKALLTVEGGQVYLDGFLQLTDLVKRGNHEG